MAKEQTYQYKLVSNYDVTSEGFIRADNSKSALETIMERWLRENPQGRAHPTGVYGIYSAEIRAPTEENPVLARYLSATAATWAEAPFYKLVHMEEDGLVVEGVKTPLKKERIETF